MGLRDLRARCRMLLRQLEDSIVRPNITFVVSKKNPVDWGSKMGSLVSIEQPIPVTPLSENKIHNLSLATEKIQNIVIHPDETFSFWYLVGAPSRRKGYREGRVLNHGKIQSETGGGLCQLSGLIYHLALKAGLQVVERHAHSVDLYAHANRYSPLGADATVVFGYKDLRLKNNLESPICFRFSVDKTRIIGSVCGDFKLRECEIEFTSWDQGDLVFVRTKRAVIGDSQGEELSLSVYRKPKESALA